jgi:hypothetical protein
LGRDLLAWLNANELQHKARHKAASHNGTPLE